MTRFSKLTFDESGRPVETDIREIKQSDMMKCAHFIMTPKHYRADGTCRCDDIAHTEMAKWGYRWEPMRGRWI